MRIRVDADVAPVVMQGALDCMMLALIDERPLNDLERMGWLVVSHNIVRRLTSVSVDGCADKSAPNSSVDCGAAATEHHR